MQLSHFALVAVALAAGGVLLGGIDAPPSRPTPETPSTPPATPEGHYVLVVQGDRNGLKVTHASRKPDPWAGVPKGFDSGWRLRVRDAAGGLLADVPLDVSAFDTRPEAVGMPLRVEGCQVHDSRIAMLVNVPRFVAATSYEFSRGEADGSETVLGTYGDALVRRLAGDAR